uniref:Trafficking protein particle complex subunit 11 n=1 Tax=Cacopsylla melanoneura TaxID=428564 RepID=A0A8D8R6E7_9HEMI
MMSAPNYDEFDFPIELTTQPLPVVGICGLDTVNNAIHCNVWEAFNNIRKQNRPLVNFKLITPEHEFPTRKPKKSSYECYIPKGILKRNWMDKHMNHAPAVIIMFYDLDWNDPQWAEKQTECASRVKSLKLTLEGRHTKVALVLIQQEPPIPSGEEIIGGDKSLALIQECELNSKYLLLLPYNTSTADQMQGYVLNLQTTFHEMCIVYFNQLIRDVKSHKSTLIKTIHAYLFIRHTFKMAFYAEMKGEFLAAHKYYNQAYLLFSDIKMTHTNIHECKVVASYIMYKMVSLLFVLNQPRDAIQTFHSHVDKYKFKFGNELLLFEHHAWLSRQYAVFADLFESTIRNGLPASQARHPGFYYQQAAKHCINRRTARNSLCASVTAYPEPDPLQGSSTLDYYGQRPWRPGKLSAEPPDPKKERDGIQALQWLEKTRVDHSMIIIGHLGSAMAQFNTYRCPRMKKYLVIQMAEEYLSSRDYGKALTLMSHMLGDYKNEHWTRLVDDITRPALYCAFVTASVEEYLTLSLDTDKVSTLVNLTRVMNNEMPQAIQYTNHAHNLDELKILWIKNLAKSDNANIEVEMRSEHACVQVKTRLTVDEEAKYMLTVYLRSHFIEPVTFSSLSCTIGDSNLLVCTDLTLPPNQLVECSAEFIPLSCHINTEVTVSHVTLGLETAFRKLALKFMITKDPLKDLPLWRPIESKSDLEMSNVVPLHSVFIVPNTSEMSLDITHDNPALLLEWYPITIKLTNQSSHPLSSLSLVLTCPDSDNIDLCEDSQHVTNNDSTNNPAVAKFPLNRAIGELAPRQDGGEEMGQGGQYETIVYVRCTATTPEGAAKLINVKVSYSSYSDPSVLLTKESAVKLNVTKPFDISSSFLSNSFEPISVFHSNEQILIQPLIQCVSPWSIVIEDTFISIPDSIDMKHETKCCLELCKGQAVTCIACVVIKEPRNLCLGVFTVKWRRKDSRLGTVTSCIELPRVDVLPLPIQLSLNLPAHGLVRTPMTICYTLYNYLNSIITVQILMESSEAFIFSGYKQVVIKLVPDSGQEFKFKIYPQLSGLVALPGFKINLLSKHEGLTQQTIDDMLIRSIPSHIYVLPQPKGIESSQQAQLVMQV